MAEYIERKAVLALAKDICVLTKWDSEYHHRSIDPIDVIELPAADVRPVKRGMWASVFDIGTVCNQCGFDIEEHGYDVRTDGEPNFCPNCGADMRPESPKEEISDG